MNIDAKPAMIAACASPARKGVLGFTLLVRVMLRCFMMKVIVTVKAPHEANSCRKNAAFVASSLTKAPLSVVSERLYLKQAHRRATERAGCSS
jgi:hypothetical protein